MSMFWIIPLVLGAMPWAMTQAESPAPHPTAHHATPHHHGHVVDAKDFLLQMIPHHAEAVTTSQALLVQTRNLDVRRFAQAVIAVQQAEIVQMQQWLQDDYSATAAEIATAAAAYVPMMGSTEGLAGTAAVRQYMADMIVHHQGAVTMAQALLALSLPITPDLRRFAEQIIATQTAEIAQLQRWLTAIAP